METSQNGLTRGDAEKVEGLAVFFPSTFTNENSDEIPSILRNRIDKQLTQHTIKPEEVRKKPSEANPTKLIS